ncbi:MAG: hypothetical protein ACKOFZ_04080, partial [Ilumatobacteraceae bacterium]
WLQACSLIGIAVWIEHPVANVAAFLLIGRTQPQLLAREELCMGSADQKKGCDVSDGVIDPDGDSDQ